MTSEIMFILAAADMFAMSIDERYCAWEGNAIHKKARVIDCTAFFILPATYGNHESYISDSRILNLVKD